MLASSRLSLAGPSCNASSMRCDTAPVRVAHHARHFHTHLDRRIMPDLLAIFADRTVGGELARACRVADRQLRPAFAIRQRRAHSLLTGDIVGEVRQHQEWIAL